MWPSSPSKRQTRSRLRGFTLIEALVTLVILVIILVAGAQLLFRTRESAERQRFQVEARQTARAAIEYVHFLLRGATDMNARKEAYPNPGLLLVWVYPDPGGGPVGGTPRQLTYDNVTDATYADLGTDIITFARADQYISVGFPCWPGNLNAVNFCVGFTQGCNDIAANFALFKQLTGAHIDPATDKEVSEPLIITGNDGSWALMRITDYNDHQNLSNDHCSRCPQLGCDSPGLWVKANPGLSSGYNAPGCCPTFQNKDPQLGLGVRYVSLRVRDGALQQKNGVFDPLNPDDGFFTVMPNVEDLQLAYFFRDGSVRNDRLPRDCSWATNCVPAQENVPWNPDAGLPENHAANVIGLRITITARSSQEVPVIQEPTARFRQPVAENHDPAAAPDRFYRYQNSVFVLLRNRTPRA